MRPLRFSQPGGWAQLQKARFPSSGQGECSLLAQRSHVWKYSIAAFTYGCLKTTCRFPIGTEGHGRSYMLGIWQAVCGAMGGLVSGCITQSIRAQSGLSNWVLLRAIQIDPHLGFLGNSIGHFFLLLGRLSAAWWLQNSQSGGLVGQEYEDGSLKTQVRVRFGAKGTAGPLCRG